MSNVMWKCEKPKCFSSNLLKLSLSQVWRFWHHLRKPPRVGWSDLNLGSLSPVSPVMMSKSEMLDDKIERRDYIFLKFSLSFRKFISTWAAAHNSWRMVAIPRPDWWTQEILRSDWCKRKLSHWLTLKYLRSHWLNMYSVQFISWCMCVRYKLNIYKRNAVSKLWIYSFVHVLDPEKIRRSNL